MQMSALVLATLLAEGCMQPAFIGTDRTDRLSPCRATDSCDAGGGDSNVTVGIVLGAAVVSAVALAMHRYVLSSG